MAKAPPTYFQVTELDNGKLLVVGILSKAQLKELYRFLEPKSRSWRGQYQSMARALVTAYDDWRGK